jgi:hypothetical protein
MNWPLLQWASPAHGTGKRLHRCGYDCRPKAEAQTKNQKLKTKNSKLETRNSKLKLTNNSYLSRVQRPTRYLGREINAVIKDPGAVSLRAALLFPDLYEVGMSHLGLGLLYGILNREDHIWAERAYAPAPDLEAELRARGQALASLESGTPLAQFDLLGVSFQYELGYTNFLNLLDLGGVPLLAEARTAKDPVVIGGGPACFNPEPVAPFLDALVLGDGEEALLEVAQVVRAWRQAHGARPELWRALEELPGVYVPAFFHPEFDGQGRLREIMDRGRRTSIAKRVLDDLNRIALSPQALVPQCQIIHDRLNLEISRGCTRGCRYCQAGMIYRPVRERDPAAALAWVEAALAATGFEELSLLSLSVGDYGPLAPLLKELMNRLAPPGGHLPPSLRAGHPDRGNDGADPPGAPHRTDPGPGVRQPAPAPGDQQELAGRDHHRLGQPGLCRGLAAAQALFHDRPAPGGSPGPAGHHHPGKSNS